MHLCGDNVRRTTTHLSDPVWQPAQNINRDHSQDEIGNFPMRSLLLLGLVFGTHCAQLADHEEVEEQDQDRGDEEAQSKGVQSERLLTVHYVSLRPVNVTVSRVVVIDHRIGVHKDGQHEHR